METKYRACEQAGIEASAELQAAARRVLEENKAVAEENKRLRQLLAQHGLTEIEMDGLVDRPENPQHSSPQSAVLESLIGQRKPCGPGGCGPSSNASASSSADNRRHSAVPPRSAHQLQVSQLVSPQYPSPSSATSSSSMRTPSLTQYPMSQSIPAYPMTSESNHHSSGYGMPMDDHFMWQETYSGQTSTRPADSSSCYVAADAIRSIKPDMGYELEAELGCSSGQDCNVPNTQIFSIMDRYSGR